jgi:methylthioxylose transferase
VAVALVWGTLTLAGAGVSLRAAPLMGHWRWQGGAGLVVPALIGLAVTAAGPAVAARLAPRPVALAAASGAVAVAWTVALAAAVGWDRVTAPLVSRHEYEPFAARVGDVGALVRHYTAGLAGAPVHVQGHPPGPVVLAWLLDRAGLGGAGWLAAIALAGWGVAVAAAVAAVAIVAGDDAARRAAPALAVLPAAVWAGTSLDALFAGVTAAAVALAVLASARRSTSMAAGAGVVAGAALLLTYGAVPVVAIAAVAAGALAPTGHRARLLAAAVSGLAAAPGLAAAAGFWWPAGLAATEGRYWAGVGAVRPALYTTVAGNPAALALAVGPAAAVGLAGAARRLRRRPRADLLPLLALAAVVVADLSQMSRGEVERIWLPFVPWLAIAIPGQRRGLLALQVITALLLQAVLASPW